MKKILIMIIALLIYTSLALAQGMSAEWIRTHHRGQGDAVAVDSLGNVYVSGNGGTIKYDANGNELWVGAGGKVIAVDSAGNVYVTGYGNTIKFDAAGNELWTKPSGRALAISSSGEVYVTGDSGTFKYDVSGIEAWHSATYNCIPLHISVSSSGNVYVTGVGGEWYMADYCTIKYDAGGNEQWVKRFDSGDNDLVVGLAVDALDNVYVVGSSGPWYDPDFVTIKYAPDGNMVWLSRYNSGSYDVPLDMAVDNSGNIYVTGFTWDWSCYKYTTVKLDATGNTRWVRNYAVGCYDYATAIAVDSFGNAYVTGQSGSYYSGTDFATIKYDTNGNQVAVAKYDSGGWDYPHDVAVDSSGHAYVIGMGSGGDYVTIKYQGDTEGPIISILHTDNVWPPNGKTINANINGTIVDNGSGVANASYIVEDEYNEVTPSGTISIEPSGNFSLGVPLEASRRGSDVDGRVYTINITALDNAGNLSTKSTVVTISHDQGASK